VRRALLAFVAVGLLGAAWLAPASAQTLPGSTSEVPGSIQHLVVIEEENATFDHIFGWLLTAHGYGPGRVVPQEGGEQKIKGFSKLGPNAFTVPQGEEVLSNGSTAARQAYDHGNMDGFALAQLDANKNPGLSFTVVDPPANPPWGLLAQQGVVFDQYFSSSLGGSLPNTLNLVAGTAAGRNAGASADFRSLWNSHIPTIFDAAQKTPDVSWRFYVGGLEHIRYNKVANGTYADSSQATPSQLYWAPILSMKRFWTDPQLAMNIRTQNDLFTDAAAGRLPSISYVLPQPTSHEPKVESPDLRALSIVNAIRTSQQWPNTAIVITWDDWGGYYDHVAPPKAGGHQLGFRVPMILLSPWALQNQVSHERLDHSSIPALAAKLFDLPGDWTPRTDEINGVWTTTPNDVTQVTSLDHEPRYAAAGMQHASSVFVLYLMTLVVITGVLFVLGVTFRAARSGEGNQQP
jgi:phospholipase C